MSAIRIAPSLLSADFARLGQEVEAVLTAGADCIHFDVMDNHYVPNLTCGPMVCQAIRPYSKAPIDVHLMVKPVDAMVSQFAKAGADIISFHPEASEHIDRTIQLIHDNGCKAGLAFNPATPLHHLDHLIQNIDLILIMLVNPGFGGQTLIPHTIDKIRSAKERIKAYQKECNRDIWLEVDGGITLNNIALVTEAGADTLVMGSAIFGQKDYVSTINNMRKTILASQEKQIAKHAKPFI